MSEKRKKYFLAEKEKIAFKAIKGELILIKISSKYVAYVLSRPHELQNQIYLLFVLFR